MTIIPRAGDIGGFTVYRALPFRDRRMVGPFIFWDQMGPGEFLSGHGIDVRPHPHIGLSTVTYLFEGSLDHKDSLGTDVRIAAGDVNLMTAGAGIVHSERTGQDVRQSPSRIFGIQSWLAQPLAHENGAPAFSHTGAGALPAFDDGGVSGRVILGEYAGLRAPVPLQWDTVYVDLRLRPGAKAAIPPMAEERALYTLHGTVSVDSDVCVPGRMIVLRPGTHITITAQEEARVMLLGGAAMDGPRYIYWNFVSSSRERLEQAKEDWRNRLFPSVPGDDAEFIPLPATGG
jgi:redox-sensitive bicupin YhaK (pirin superfamily)